ncbi:hypothetical protein AYO44_02730 [Planctomycetaceae bacterium SCGC AG-212-F19]|nr:hypothetical protein AYO44_02730 [Planctomycetaceae bacterium SCGC AG-212-F19]
MNLKTTLVLLILTTVGAVWYYLAPPVSWLGGKPPTAEAAAAGSTIALLEKELTPAKVAKIEVRRADGPIVLEKSPGGWTIEGKWLTRPREVDELVGVLTHLRSRFAPEPLSSDPAELQKYGLVKPALTVDVRAGATSYRLSFGEDPHDSNRFTRSTFLRVNDGNEVIRLGPGLVAVLDRPLDYYLQRRLFASERVAKSTDATEKVERLQADLLAAKGKDHTFTLSRAGKEWELKEPVRDRADPDKLQAVLTAVPDIWAEHFVRGAKKDLAEYGLDKPEQALTVKRPDGTSVTLLIGKESPRTEERKVTRPAPPGMPMPAMVDKVVEKFRYAKIQGNDQIFEIKDEKLKDVFVALDTLRDPRLARFKPEDVTRVELKYKDTEIVFAKKDNKFSLEKPVAAPAETSKIMELLDRLSQLEAKGEDVKDAIDAKEFQLDPPAGTVVLTIEEELKKPDSDEKEKKTRTIKFSVGKHDAEKKKLFVKVDDWPRTNAVDEALVKLVERPVLAYRGRTIFDLADKGIEHLEVQRGEEKYALAKKDAKWRLTAPVDAEADAAKVGNLTADLQNLNVIEYVAEEAKEEDLDKLYGLAKPALSVTLKTDGGEKAKSWILRIGKQREGKADYFAKLDDAPQVFAVRKDVRDALDQPSLTLRPTQLWQVPLGDVASLRILKEGQPEYSLKRDGAGWKIAGPFDASAPTPSVTAMLGNVSTLRAERYEVHAAKELDKYGLDKPYLKLVVREADKDKEAGKEHTLLIGKPTAEGAKTRYARVADGDAVIVVSEALIGAVDRGALDLLDRHLLKLDKEKIVRVESTGANPLTLNLVKDDKWEAETPQAKFAADNRVAAGVLTTWFNLTAQKFAAYGSKVDLAPYGLDKPAQTVSITVKPPADDAKPVVHKLALGKPVEGGKGERYARLDEEPGIAVLGAAAVTELTRTYLDFVDRTLIDIDSTTINGMHRKMGEQELELAKRDDGWHMNKPDAQKADGASLEKMLVELGRLRGERIAAYPAKELKPFGLDDPAAVLTLKLIDGEGKMTVRILKIGESADAAGQTSGDRFALVEGSDKVAVLPGALVKQLVGKPIAFRDRSIAKFVSADKAVLERGRRTAVFSQVDGSWKMTQPLATDADQADLDDFINALARLRADELVSDKPEDLKPFGLDPPELRWKFFTGDKEVLSLLIGEKAKTGEPGRVYAKLAGGDVVFLLDPKLTARVLGEYRSRKLWDPVDASQVVRLEYGAPGGDPQRKPFTLEMLDNVWKLQGKPDAKLSAPAVNETLAALATLRAERYMVDKDADPKLFALDPPHVTVEIRTPTGAKRTLYIGGREGESNRRYARLTDANRTDVFVISEADAAKIVRDAAAFVEK